MRTCKSIILLLLVIVLTGCLGNEEINDLALVMAVGLDKGEKGEVIITTQVARPAEVRGEAGGSGEPIWTATAEGKTIFEAIRNLAKFASKRVYWGHNMIIVVSEDVAKDGIVDVLDFFTRNNELRMRTWIVVSEGSASEIVAVKTGLDVIPGLAIERLFRYSPIVAEAPRSNVMSLAKGYVGENVNPYLGMVKLRSRGIDEKKPNEFGSIPQVELTGTAIFRDDKMVGKLNSRESHSFLWFTESVENPIIPINCPKVDGNVSIELRENKFSLKPIYKDGIVSFEAFVKTEPHLVELGCPTELEHSEIMGNLETDIEAYIKQDFEMLLAKLQKDLKVDAIRLGRTFQGKFPQHWDEIKDDWDEMFQEVDVNITIEVELDNPQLLENPTRRSKD